MKKQKGFTLIELLIVIAIIGILAAVLMVNLASTRNKARDSAIKLEMNQIKTAMESCGLSATNGYTDCLTNADVVSLRAGCVANGGTASGSPAPSSSTWCVQYTLNSGTYWCVDSTGYAGPPSGVIPLIAVCNAFVRCRQ